MLGGISSSHACHVGGAQHVTNCHHAVPQFDQLKIEREGGTATQDISATSISPLVKEAC